MALLVFLYFVKRGKYMSTYKIYLAKMSYESARSLLESKGYNIIEYHRDLDYILVKGQESPSTYFSDISSIPHDSTRFVW